MKEITNRSALIVLPKDPYKEWAKLYNEEPNEDLENRLKEKSLLKSPCKSRRGMNPGQKVELNWQKDV